MNACLLMEKSAVQRKHALLFKWQLKDVEALQGYLRLITAAGGRGKGKDCSVSKIIRCYPLICREMNYSEESLLKTVRLLNPPVDAATNYVCFLER